MSVSELRQRYASLTEREREVMTLVVSGLSNKRIGVTLGISETTVKSHRASVRRKMQAESIVDLVWMAATLEISPVHRIPPHRTVRTDRSGPSRRGPTLPCVPCR